MQASVYSTATDVKIHKVIRREWAIFLVWLSNQNKWLEHRENEIWYAAQRKKGKTKKADEQIHAMRQELLAVARTEWLARVRHKQLHLEHWVMTPDEKQTLQHALDWTQKEMVDAYAKQQADMGPMYQRVDPSTLGTQDSGDKHLDSPSRFMHPIPREDVPVPAYANWASEVAKMFRTPRPSSQKTPQSIKSADLPNMPLYFVGALLQGTDLDEVVASNLEAFALHASEEKIREYYAEACEASVHFQRKLATVDPSRRDEVHTDFEHHMQDLARVKEHEWKAITVKELRKQRAAELERRAAQLKASRPRPRPRKQPRREFADWEYVDEYSYPEHASPRSHHSPRREYFHAHYRSPRQEYQEAYHSPRPELVEAYNSPRPRRRKRQPVMEEDAYTGSFHSEFVEEYQSPRPRRRRWQPMEEEDGHARSGLRSILRSLATIRNTGSRSRRAPRDWSSVRVDEMDLKHRNVFRTKKPQSRHGVDFIVRLDGTGSQPKPATEKLRKRRTMGVRGPGLRRGVSDAKTEIPVARQVQLGSGQKDEAESLSNSVGHWLGRSGFGLAGRNTGHREASSADQIPRGAVKGRQGPLHLGRPFRRVRFSPLIAAAVLGEDAPPNISVDEVASKFHEGFASKTSTAA
ncbi:Sterol regulatory element binding protein cleavage-activating protein [Mycena sanguinolenta]|uniref:Sterol regulatory element binding protein cleavage-activating protein n=1 Tax=Mycena sanguinolenta TaxID=230812 RepID=A0A8H7CV35_9AGAR|nr:Sterol regulatory element binding protein cleavage-activating protein [Mycena sanguinolenta]